MKNFTIGRRIAIITSVLCVVLAITSTFAVLELRSLDFQARTIVNDPLPGTIIAGRLNLLQADSTIWTELLLNAKTEAERQPLVAKMHAITKSIDEEVARYEASIFEAEDRANFDKYKALREKLKDEKYKFVEMIAADPEAAARYLVSDVVPAHEAFAAQGNIVQKFNSDAALKLANKLSADVAAAFKILLVVSISGLLAGIVGSWASIRSIRGALSAIGDQLSSGADQTASASSQVSAASQTLAEGASEQAASLEETSASLEEITSMVKRNAEAADKASVLAKETRAAADAGSVEISEMSQAMNEIKASSDDIAKIIKTIDEIAFQTNILALNAAVEAARAGEAGMGFAVVADEVRNLAQRSALSAKETADKIETAITKSERGVQISSKVAASFEQIAGKTREVDAYVEQIARASDEQSQGIGQVNNAVTQMERVTQSNAANAEETASASEELSAQAESVKEAVAELQALVGGSGSTGTRPKATAIRASIKAKTRKPARSDSNLDVLRSEPVPAAFFPSRGADSPEAASKSGTADGFESF